MLLALTIERHVITTMAFIGAAVFIERLRPPGPARWSLPPVASSVREFAAAVVRRLRARTWWEVDSFAVRLGASRRPCSQPTP
jgi:hypothetical protein